MEKRIIVAAIIVNGDKILLGKKAKGRPPYPDFWHTIGGGIENFPLAEILIQKADYDNPYLHNELQREIKEEASITIKNIQNICPKYREKPRESITKNKHGVDTYYIFLEYLCELESGEATPADDIVELKWVKKKI